MEYITTTCGTQLTYMPTSIGEGGMKIVFMSPDKNYVVCKYKHPTKVTRQDRKRVGKIVSAYRQTIFQNAGGHYFKNLMCWPTYIFDNPRDGFGVVCPVYPSNFFFETGRNEFARSPKPGKEKNGRWFLSLYQRNCLHDSELGDFASYLRMALLLARSVRRLHSAGIVHSDLSHNNVLLDPVKRTICIIDMDTLVVQDMHPPEIQGTPGYIAPEVMETLYAPMSDPNKNLVSQQTEVHSLAVMIYELLMYRHPLKGPKVHDASDPKRDEELMMGKRALFIEHPENPSNRPNKRWAQRYYGSKKLRKNKKVQYLPYALPDDTPYTILGPYLAPLIEQAFITGLHNPSKRPSAREWEKALIRTADNILPCSNSKCEQKYFIYNLSVKPRCPYCETIYKYHLPMLELYYTHKGDKFSSENHRKVLWHGASLFPWHVNRFVNPNEQLKEDQRGPLAKIFYKRGKWYVRNTGLKGHRVYDANGNELPQSEIAIGKDFELEQGQQILLDPSNRGGRLAIVRFAHSSGSSSESS